MALTKRQIRQALAPLVGDLGPEGYLTTTAAGNANGLTFVCDQLYNYGADQIRNLWALPTSGTQEGKYRQIDDFDGTTPSSSSTATIKGTAWSAALASAVTIELYRYSPAFYTLAINNAIISSYPWLFNPALDASITLTADDYKYTLPSGITPEMVKRIAVEGVTPFASQPAPAGVRDDWVFNPDNTEIWFNMRDSARVRNFTTGDTLYVYAQKYLTALTAESTAGTIASDTTATVELTTTTRFWRLFLRFAKAEFFTLLAGTASNPDRDIHVKMASEAWSEARQFAPLEAMPPLETTYAW